VIAKKDLAGRSTDRSSAAVNGIATVEVLRDEKQYKLQSCFRADPALFPVGPRGAEVVAVGAVAHLELVPDDGKPHRMGAEEEVTVDNGVEAEIVRDLGGATAVPAEAVTVFGFHGVGATPSMIAAGGSGPAPPA
jgi:hypothetical protein